MTTIQLDNVERISVLSYRQATESQEDGTEATIVLEGPQDSVRLHLRWYGSGEWMRGQEALNTLAVSLKTLHERGEADA